jgi:ATP-dependent DNA helicase RecG
MIKNNTNAPIAAPFYKDLLSEIKSRFRKAQNRLATVANIDDLRKGNVSQRRNPLIADLFRRIEMVEAWGRGMPLILKNEPDVVFREIGNLFIVSFNRSSFLEQKDEGEAVTQETTQETTQEKIMASLRAEPTLTRKLLAQRLSISEDGVKYHLNKLKAAGRIRHVGPTKAGRWEMIDDRSDASGDDGTGGGDE